MGFLEVIGLLTVIFGGVALVNEFIKSYEMTNRKNAEKKREIEQWKKDNPNFIEEWNESIRKREARRAEESNQRTEM